MKITNPSLITIPYDSVLVEVKKKREKPKEEFVKNAEGILVPNKEAYVKRKEDPFVLGLVVKSGEGYISPNDSSTVPLRVKTGDYIIFDSRNNANNIIFEAEDATKQYHLVREQNVLAIVAKELADYLTKQMEEENEEDSKNNAN
mgnify:CR=1 FL=1